MCDLCNLPECLEGLLYFVASWFEGKVNILKLLLDQQRLLIAWYQTIKCKTKQGCLVVDLVWTLVVDLVWTFKQTEISLFLDNFIKQLCSSVFSLFFCYKFLILHEMFPYTRARKNIWFESFCRMSESWNIISFPYLTQTYCILLLIGIFPLRWSGWTIALISWF